MNLQRGTEKLFTFFWRLIFARPGAVIAAWVLLALFSAVGSAFFLRLNSDQDRLVSPEVPFQKRYLEMLSNFGDQEYVFVVIATGATVEGKARAARFADDLAGRLSRHPESVRSVHYRLTPSELGSGALLYASVPEARALSSAVRQAAPALRDWYADGSLAGLLSRGADLLAAPAVDPQGGEAMIAPALEGVAGLLRGIDGALQGQEASLPSLALSEPEYFFTGNGRFLIMRVLPEKDYGAMDVIGRPLALIRQALEETRARFPHVEAGLTGRPVLQADEMQTTNRDMTRASVIAVALVGLLYLFVLHGVARPVLLVFSLLVAMAVTYGFATVAVGELNLLSIVFALVLVGIGIDFGAHVVMRSVEEELSGRERDDAVREALLTAGPGVLLGAVTTVCAFFTVLGSDFVGLAQLGLIGGVGILICFAAMTTLLPALLLVAGRRHLFPAAAPRIHALPFLARFQRRPLLLLLAVAALTLAGLPGLFREHFNYNLLELQARGLESVRYEKILIEETQESTWYAVFTAQDLDTVRKLAAQLRQVSSVGKVESIFDLLPDALADKRKLYAPAAQALSGLPSAPADPGAPDPGRLAAALQALGKALADLEEKLFAAGAGDELEAVGKIQDRIASVQAQLKADPARAARLADLQERLRRQIGAGVAELRTRLAAEKVSPGDLPPALRELYIGRDGSYQIKVTPVGNVWDFDVLERFVADLRQVDPQVTGVPVVVLESARLMNRTFLTAALWTVVLVGIILWIYTRSLRYVFLALLPLAFGMVWLLQLMGLSGWEFNLANFFGIPILIGIGVDGAIHLVSRWEELAGRQSLFSTSTPTAVALSFLTTVIGFGGLLAGHHRGLASLGAVIVIGSLTTLAASLLVLPAALKLLHPSPRS